MVKIESKFDENSADSLNKQSFKKLFWVMIVFGGVFVLLGSLMLLGAEDSSDVTLGIVYMAIGVSVVPLFYLLLKANQRSINKSSSMISNHLDETFTFSDDGIVIESNGYQYHSVVEMGYSILYRVEETPTHYLLYISKVQAHVVAKNGVVEGSLEELDQLFTKYFGEKYIKAKK